MKKKYIAPEFEFSVTSAEDIMLYASSDISMSGLFGDEATLYQTYIDEGKTEQAAAIYR